MSISVFYKKIYLDVLRLVNGRKKHRKGRRVATEDSYQSQGDKE